MLLRRLVVWAWRIIESGHGFPTCSHRVRALFGPFLSGHIAWKMLGGELPAGIQYCDSRYPSTPQNRVNERIVSVKNLAHPPKRRLKKGNHVVTSAIGVTL